MRVADEDDTLPNTRCIDGQPGDLDRLRASGILASMRPLSWLPAATLSVMYWTYLCVLRASR